MSAEAYILKTQSAGGFTEFVHKLYGFRPYSHKECFRYKGSHKFSHKVSENYTSPTRRSEVPVFPPFSLCTVLIQCSAIGTRFTVGT